ncbi:MAG: glycosyltransferase family 2 protein [Lachnospiraceae bacterium]|nr:glycosyltransferase family 2 protein [Lachnospiraceae bacterium]
MIDIIMPCYNAEHFIEETIQSVLRQTDRDFRLICVDDCSKDKTFEILQQFAQQDVRITVLRNKHNCGIAATRNKGIRAGNGEFIAFLDDDDIMPPDRLEIGRRYLEKHYHIGVVAGNYLIFDEEGKKKVVQKERFFSAEEVRAILPFVNIVPNGSTLIRRELIEKHHIYFHEEYGIEDYHFYAELSRVTDIYVLPEVLLEHRVTATQYSSVCVRSEQRFQRRQEAFDRVHKLLMHNITDKCYSQDMKIYTRFMQENIKDIKLKEVVRLYFAMLRLKKSVKRKGNAEYTLYCKSADNAIKRAVGAYIQDRRLNEK